MEVDNHGNHARWQDLIARQEFTEKKTVCDMDNVDVHVINNKDGNSNSDFQV